jgi:hypothetical protein
MGLMTDIGIKRKLNRLDELSGDEAVALRAELCGIASRERDKAIKKGSRYSFCLYSTLLGDLYLQTDDQSDAIRPYGLAYLTACAMGERCDAERLQAVEGLATSNIFVGEFVFALDLILEAIEGAARRPTRFEVSDLVVVLTDAAMNEGNRREVRSFYDDLREVCGRGDMRDGLRRPSHSSTIPSPHPASDLAIRRFEPRSPPHAIPSSTISTASSSAAWPLPPPTRDGSTRPPSTSQRALR